MIGARVFAASVGGRARLRRTVRSLARIAPVVFLLAAARTVEPTVFIAGDSTAAMKLPEKRPETGWGEELQSWFESGTARVDDRAKNGRSTRTFISEGLWTALLNDLHAGDYVVIQFGHNDESREEVDRYTPPADYRANLVRFVTDVRQRRATPILMTPVVRRHFDAAGVFADTHGEYPGIVRDVAAELRVPLVDMHRATEALVSQLGPDSSRALYLQLAPGANPNYPSGVQDNTHFSPVGARAVARMVAEGLRALDLPLARLIRSAVP